MVLWLILRKETFKNSRDAALHLSEIIDTGRVVPAALRSRVSDLHKIEASDYAIEGWQYPDPGSDATRAVLKGARLKYTSRGKPRRFEGVTTVANIEDGPLRDLIQRIIGDKNSPTNNSYIAAGIPSVNAWQRQARRVSLPLLATVKLGSEHVTVYDGVCYEELKGGVRGWEGTFKYSQLNDETRQEIKRRISKLTRSQRIRRAKRAIVYEVVQERMIKALSGFSSFKKPVFKPWGVAAFAPHVVNRAKVVMIMRMIPATAEDLAVLTKMQEAIRRQTGIVNFGAFVGHVTLGYCVNSFENEGEFCRFKDYLERLSAHIRSLSDNPDYHFEMPTIEVSRFTNMESYPSVASFSWKGYSRSSPFIVYRRLVAEKDHSKATADYGESNLVSVDVSLEHVHYLKDNQATRGLWRQAQAVMKERLGVLKELNGCDAPAQVTCIITTDSDKLITDYRTGLPYVAACNNDAKEVFIHPYFFSLSGPTQVVILYHFLISFMMKHQNNEEEALEDTLSGKWAKAARKIEYVAWWERVRLEHFAEFNLKSVRKLLARWNKGRKNCGYKYSSGYGVSAVGFVRRDSTLYRNLKDVQKSLKQTKAYRRGKLRLNPVKRLHFTIQGLQTGLAQSGANQRGQIEDSRLQILQKVLQKGIEEANINSVVLDYQNDIGISPSARICLQGFVKGASLESLRGKIQSNLDSEGLKVERPKGEHITLASISQELDEDEWEDLKHTIEKIQQNYQTRPLGELELEKVAFVYHCNDSLTKYKYQELYQLSTSSSSPQQSSVYGF
ncbi:MAG: hypothetical protein JRI96_17915, partial [Deltaproteobacteria bacterium]|nr:hypothetical protein [Deltaproteobacteria bacterium]